jgi:transcriptional regulator with XRE-family HTH domain
MKRVRALELTYEIRKRLGETVEQFASRLGVSAQTIRRYERGRRIRQETFTALQSLVQTKHERQLLHLSIASAEIEAEEHAEQTAWRRQPDTPDNDDVVRGICELQQKLSTSAFLLMQFRHDLSIDIRAIDSGRLARKTGTLLKRCNRHFDEVLRSIDRR